MYDRNAISPRILRDAAARLSDAALLRWLTDPEVTPEAREVLRVEHLAREALRASAS